MLRALPWLLLVAVLTFVPVGRLARDGWLLIGGALVLVIVLTAPWLGGAAQRYSAALARGETPSLIGLLRSAGPNYIPLLGWTLLQALLVLLLLLLILAPPPGERGLLGWLGLAGGLWLWALSRLWGFVFLPLLAVRGREPRQTARLALLLLLEHPGALLAGFVGRQLLGASLALSGLGLIAGLGGILPLQAALVIRERLRPHGLDLAPPGAPESNHPLDLPTLGQLWRPWR